MLQGEFLISDLSSVWWFGIYYVFAAFDQRSGCVICICLRC